MGYNYEMRVGRTKTKSVHFAGNKLDGINSTDQTSHTVRLLQDGKISVASSFKPNCGDELIKQAAATVCYGSPCDVPFVGATNITAMSLEDTTTFTSKEMIEIASDLMADLRKLDSRLSASVEVKSTINEVSLQTSNGFNNSYRKSVWTCSGSINLADGDDNLAISASQSAMGPHFNVKEITDTISRKLDYAKNIVPFKAGAYPVIFTPSEVGFVINPVVASLNGLAMYRQVSPYSGKLGQELLDPRFTLIDDGSLGKQWTSKPFDMEGTPTKRNVLVQNGCLTDMFLDRKVAALLGKESSGNASLADPAPNHLRLVEGSKTLDALIKSIDYGLLIDGTMGAWSGNPYSGIVTGTISMGLAIENGKIIGRVKDCMYTINAFEHLKKHFVDCSLEAESCFSMSPFGGSYNKFPYVMLDEVVISTEN